MKITLVLLIAGVIQSFAATSYSQSARISLDLKNVTIEEVLNAIESKSDFYFFFNQKLIDVNRRVDVVADNLPIAEILNALFKGSDIEYVVYDRQIILAPKEAAHEMKNPQQQKVTGVVKDASNSEPLIGVNIQIEGTLQGTTTDMDGKYEINVPGPSAVLTFSFVGFITQKIEAGDKTSIDVNMEPDVKSLDEVVVIGYGVQKKKDLTGSVGIVNVEEMKKVKAAGIAEALQGQVAGVSVQTNGDPGRMADVRIRGVGSFSDVGPLYVIDGLILNDANHLNPPILSLSRFLRTHLPRHCMAPGELTGLLSLPP